MAQVLNRGQKAAATKASKKKASDMRTLFERAASGKRTEWQVREQRSYDFFLNSQLTEGEQRQLAAAGMPDFIINRITPIIETMKYFVTAQNPRWRAVGVDGSDSDIAKIHTDMIDYSWYISGGRSMFGQVIQDCLVKGKGYVHIIVDPDADRGLGEVKFERVDPFHVYTSNRASDFFERDATYHIIKKDLPREELMRMLPEYKDQIMRAKGYEEAMQYSQRVASYSYDSAGVDISDSIQPAEMGSPVKAKDGEEDTVLQYYEKYEPLRLKFYNVFILQEPSEQQMEELLAVVDKNIKDFESELSVQYIEKKKALEEALTAGEIVQERFDIELRKTEDMMTQAIQEKRSIMINEAKEKASNVVQKVMSEDEYEKVRGVLKDVIQDAIPFWEKKYKKECVVGDQWLYEQVMNISFCPLIAIPYLHTGTTCPMSAVTPLIGKQREINKAHQIMIHHANLSSSLRWKYVEGEIDTGLWESYASSPNALLPYRPGLSQDGPKEIFPQPLNTAFFTVEQDAKTDMEYMAGIQPPSMGISQSNDETYRGFLAKDEYGTRRVKSWVMNILEPGLEHIGKVYTEMAKEVYTIHKVFRIVQPNASGGEDEKEVQINVPIYSDVGDEVGRWNDYATTRYDLRMVAGSTLPINRWALREEYKQWLELGIIDDITFREMTDLPNKEQISERMSRVSQLQQQAQEMEETIKDKEGTIETLERQLVQAGIKMKILEAGVEVDRTKTETKMQQKLGQNRIQDDVKLTRSRMGDILKQTKEKSSGKENKKST